MDGLIRRKEDSDMQETSNNIVPNDEENERVRVKDLLIGADTEAKKEAVKAKQETNSQYIYSSTNLMQTQFSQRTKLSVKNQTSRARDYTLMLNEAGGIESDCMVTRIGPAFFSSRCFPSPSLLLSFAQVFRTRGGSVEPHAICPP